MEYNRLKLKKSSNITEIILNNPGRLNAIDLTMLQELMIVLDQCSEDIETRVIILSGEGNSFCSGADLQSILEAGEQMPVLAKEMAKVAADVALKIRNINKPVIAALKGAVAGAGFMLALVSDYRVAADNCKFILSFIKVGLIPDTGGMFVLCRLMGTGKALELAMSGKPVSTRDLEALGLLTKVVAPSDLENETMHLACSLAESPGQALGMIKTLVNRVQFSGFEDYLVSEVEYQDKCIKTDFEEGIRAFIEKRKPIYISR